MRRELAAVAIALSCCAVGASAGTPLAPAPPVLEPRVVLDAATPRPGSVVAGALEVRGHARAPEGVLHIDLYVRPHGASAAARCPVARMVPAIPLGSIPFTIRWVPSGTQRVDLDVVAYTPLRTAGATAKDLRGTTTTRKPTAARPVGDRVVAPARAARPTSSSTPATALARPDDSGRVFGAVADLLPYGRPRPVLRTVPVRTEVAPPPPADGRSPWRPIAAGLVLLLGTAHVHRALRTHPVPEGRP